MVQSDKSRRALITIMSIVQDLIARVWDQSHNQTMTIINRRKMLSLPVQKSTHQLILMIRVVQVQVAADIVLVTELMIVLVKALRQKNHTTMCQSTTVKVQIQAKDLIQRIRSKNQSKNQYQKIGKVKTTLMTSFKVR